MRFLRQFAIIALFLVFQVQGQRYPLLGLDDDNEDLERRPKGETYWVLVFKLVFTLVLALGIGS